MFGIGFPELVLVAIIGIVVLGPEHMPRVARKVGALAAKMRSAATSLNDAIERDESLSELRHEVQNTRETLNEAKRAIDPLNPNHLAKSLTDTIDASQREFTQTVTGRTPITQASSVGSQDATASVDIPQGSSSSQAQSKTSSDASRSLGEQLFAHLDHYYSKRSAQRIVALSDPILVSTPIALATSRIRTRLKAPQPTSMSKCSVVLRPAREQRCHEIIRALSPGHAAPDQRAITLTLFHACDHD